MHTITLPKVPDEALDYAIVGADGSLQQLRLSEGQANELLCALAALGLEGPEPAMDLEKVLGEPYGQVDDIADEVVQAIARAGHDYPGARITWEGIRDIVGVVLLETFPPGTKREEVAADRIMAHLEGTGARELSEASRAEVARIIRDCQLYGEAGDVVFIEEATKQILRLFEGPPQSGRLTFAELDAIRSLVDHAAATSPRFAARSESRRKLVRDIRLAEDALNRLAEGDLPETPEELHLGADAKSAAHVLIEWVGRSCCGEDTLENARLRRAAWDLSEAIGKDAAVESADRPATPAEARRLRCWHCGEACSTSFHPDGPWTLQGTVECAKCSAEADEDSPYGPAGDTSEDALSELRSRVIELDGRLSALEGLPAGNDYKARLEAIVDSRIASSLATPSHVQAVSQRVDKLEDLHAGDWIDYFRNQLEAPEDLRFDERLESLSDRLAALEDLPAIDLRIEEKLGPTLEAVLDRLSKLEAKAGPSAAQANAVTPESMRAWIASYEADKATQEAAHRAHHGAIREWIERERAEAEDLCRDPVSESTGRYAIELLTQLDLMLDFPEIREEGPPPEPCWDRQVLDSWIERRRKEAEFLLSEHDTRSNAAGEKTNDLLDELETILSTLFVVDEPSPATPTCVLRKVDWDVLALGARFRYQTDEDVRWTKIGHDRVARWDPALADAGWTGQAICSSGENPHGPFQVWMEVEGEPHTEIFEAEPQTSEPAGELEYCLPPRGLEKVRDWLVKSRDMLLDTEPEGRAVETLDELEVVLDDLELKVWPKGSEVPAKATSVPEVDGVPGRDDS